MPNEDEKLKAKESSDSIADSKKIDLYINNNAEQLEAPGISIGNIFSNMGKRFHIYVFVIIAGLAAGLLVPFFMYTFREKSESSVSVLGLDYTGADSGLAPDGTSLDISYVKSSYIIQNALADVTLSKPMTVALVQPNLTVTGVLTDETKQQQDILNKLEADKSTAYAEALKNFTLKYRAQYIITLNNGFKEGNASAFYLPTDELSSLLSSITTAYNAYFNETYQDNSLPDNQMAAVDTTTLDYLDILDKVGSSLTYLQNYCTTKASKYAGFRASNGMSFTDLANVISTVRNSDIDYISSYIVTNNISKDRNLQLTNYRYQRRQAFLDLDKVDADIVTTKNSIETYQKDKVVVTNPETGATQSVEVTNDYYNQLVANLTALNESKSNLERQISILDERIAKLEGPDATAEQKAQAQAYVDSAVANANSLYTSVSEQTKELYDSSAYRDVYMHSITTVNEGETLKDNLKNFGLGAGLGLFAGVAIWFIDSLIIEMKNNRRKLEMMEAARNEK